jgi:acyl carrier protein
MTQLEDRLATILVEKLGVPADAISSHVTLDDLDIDSLLVVEFALLVKKEFGVRLEDGEITPALTVAGTAQLLASRGVAAA